MHPNTYTSNKQNVSMKTQNTNILNHKDIQNDCQLPYFSYNLSFENREILKVYI